MPEDAQKDEPGPGQIGVGSQGFPADLEAEGVNGERDQVTDDGEEEQGTADFSKSRPIADYPDQGNEEDGMVVGFAEGEEEDAPANKAEEGEIRPFSGQPKQDY